jgi:hypothetical protein
MREQSSFKRDSRFPHRPLNGCGQCHQDFTSLRLFEAHRVGDQGLDYTEHENGRRCLDTEEMQTRGWTQNDKGRWYDPAEAERARERFSAMRGSTERPSEAEDEAEAA